MTDDRARFLDREASLPASRGGNPIDLGKPRGEKGKQVNRDKNESVLEKLFSKDLIGEPEYAAGLEYHKHLCKAASGSSIPDLGRIPGQCSYDADAMQCEAVIWVERVKRDMPRRYWMILDIALHPWSHASLSEIDRLMGFERNMMQGRRMLIESLIHLAEILGFASPENKHTKCG